MLKINFRYVSFLIDNIRIYKSYTWKALIEYVIIVKLF